MLGWLLLGLLVTAAIVITVSYLNGKVAREKLREKNIMKGVVKQIVKSDGVAHIKLDAVTDEGEERQVEFRTDDYNSREIRVGKTIYA